MAIDTVKPGCPHQWSFSVLGLMIGSNQVPVHSPVLIDRSELYTSRHHCIKNDTPVKGEILALVTHQMEHSAIEMQVSPLRRNVLPQEMV